MKKTMITVLLLAGLLLCGCEGGTASPPAAVDSPAPGELPTSTEGLFCSEYMGISLPVPEDWHVLELEEIAARLGYGEGYTADKREEILDRHVPYVELWAEEGASSVQMMVEALPVTASDGTVMRSPAEYMDHNQADFPRMYESFGVEAYGLERGQRELAGYDWEYFSFLFQGKEQEIKQTMMGTEKDGNVYIIYITCAGEDQTEELLSQLSLIE